MTRSGKAQLLRGGSLRGQVLHEGRVFGRGYCNPWFRVDTNLGPS